MLVALAFGWGGVVLLYKSFLLSGRLSVILKL
jgi:hypothetical protein